MSQPTDDPVLGPVPPGPTGPASGPGSEPAYGLPAEHTGPRVSREQMLDVDRLRRSVHDRRIAGVCGGLARHFDVDPLLVRIVMVFLAVAGAGLVLYAGLCLVVPDENQPQASVPLDTKARSFVVGFLSVVTVFSLVTDWFDSNWMFVPAVVIAVVFWTKQPRRMSPAPPPYGVAPGVGPITPADRRAMGGYLPAPPPRQRKQGPKLFWFTGALLAITWGSLSLADNRGVNIATDAYFAAGLAIVGVMLVVGSIYGRPGGLIFLGLLLALCLAFTTAIRMSDFENQRLTVTPTSAADVSDTYALDVGEVLVDLTHVRDLGQLDGRTIAIRADAGRVEVRVPQEMGVVIEARVAGPGNITLPAKPGGKKGTAQQGGVDFTRTARYAPTGPAPTLSLDVSIDVGKIILVRSGS